MIRALALAATEGAPLAEAVAACPAGLLAGEPGSHRDLAAAAAAALTGALGAVPAADRVAAPAVLAVTGPCVAAASRFVLRCRDTSRRLRPFESVRLETAELIRGVAGPGWAGTCYLLASPGNAAGHQAVLAATVLRRRHPAVLAGELLLAGAGALAVVAVVEPVPPPAAVAPGPAGSALLGHAARTPVEVAP